MTAARALALGLAAWLAAGGTCALAAGPPPRPPLAPMVAHAGGGVNGGVYWNSLEALERSHAAGFRAVEIDLNWTADKRLVALHDWGATFRRLYLPWEPTWLARAGAWLRGKPPRPHLGEFLKLGRPGGPTPLPLPGLMRWLRAHPETVLITDVKSRNLEALAQIGARWPALLPQVVPQAYRFGQVARIRALGYPRVILTLYRLKADNEAVVAFAREARPAAVTAPAARAGLAELAARLQSAGIFVYAHTLNDPPAARRLLAGGVGGLYTDTLPPDFARAGTAPAPDPDARP